ncbi:unnamed protein product [Onchocerca flexuosa]|uniref:Vps4_C domain-containing protein n=1 Tax=Onchocerca flexuosa TaxID=387005 RepID=A0A183HJV0_9BILA|nr:unnamed protein product [Onchocerca flexuosa]
MGDDRTSAPVRQLVEHFDHLLSNEEMKKMGEADDSLHDENLTVLDETQTTKPLNPPIAPENSLAFSDEVRYI